MAAVLSPSLEFNGSIEFTKGMAIVGPGHYVSMRQLERLMVLSPMNVEEETRIHRVTGNLTGV
jgi:hypothetical protein